MEKETYVFELQYCAVKAAIIDYHHEPRIIIESHVYSAALYLARKRFKKIKKIQLEDLEKIQVVNCKVFTQLDLFE